jgi:hypothetical protein
VSSDVASIREGLQMIGSAARLQEFFPLKYNTTCDAALRAHFFGRCNCPPLHDDVAAVRGVVQEVVVPSWCLSRSLIGFEVTKQVRQDSGEYVT